MAQTSTPFWLEIKTEYIDANLDKVIAYLAKESQNPGHDAFYGETVSLLKKRVRELEVSLAGTPVWESDEAADKVALTAALRMLGACLLVEGLTGELSRECLFFFIKTLAAIVPASYSEDLTQIAVRSLIFPLKRPVISWPDIREVQAEVTAHKLIVGIQFADTPAPECWFQGKGSLAIRNGVIDIFSTNRDDARLTRTAASLPLLDGLLKVQTDPGDRIQQKDEDNLEAMDQFTTGFLRDAEKAKPSVEKSLKTYSAGDTFPVRFTGVDPSGNLLVESAEGDHERIDGIIPVKSSSVLFYKMSDFARFFRTGDCFDAKLVGEVKKSFNLNDWFVSAVCRNVVRTRENILACLRDIKKGKMTWWTEDGYPAYSDLEEKPDGTSYEIGEYAIIYITSCSDNGYVYASVIEPSADTFDEDNSRDYCIGECIYPEDHVFSSTPVVASVIGEPLVKGLFRLLFAWQRTVGQASERFRILCTARILAAETDDTLAREYIELNCLYLKNLVAFATGRMDSIKSLNPSEALAAIRPVILRSDITRLLQAYGVDGDSAYLSEVIHGNADPLLQQLAKLIQSCNRIDDVYPAIKTVIKREITRFLAVETEDNTDFEEAAGPNLGVENSRQEFKTSFFFAPANAYEQNQEKTIFRSLCSFLNTQEGGTLYLGVNDSGGINGLDTDLDYLQKKVAGTYKGIDGYMRYITDRAKLWYDLDVRIHFQMEPLFDGRVLAIHVDPYQHGVVEFDGIPYIRNNSESVKMSQTLRRQIESRRIQGAQELSKNVVALAEAIREERQVILFAYASSNSGEVSDRHLEPFAFVGNYTYVWAYDLDDGKNKLFRISRIGNVKIDVPWTQKTAHKKSPIDIFHFQGEDAIPVKLELDLLAKNLLTEEYPDAEGDLTDLGNGRWLLTTTARQIYGIGRFYTGLVGHIKILDAPALITYARAYFESALKELK